MKTVRVTIDAHSSGGRIDSSRVDTTTKNNIAQQIAKDEMLDKLNHEEVDEKRKNDDDLQLTLLKNYSIKALTTRT